MLFRTSLQGVLRICASWLLAANAVSAVPDGPYVLKADTGAWVATSVEATADGPRARTRPLDRENPLAIPAVGQVPGFTVSLRPPAADSPDSIATDSDAPLFVVADTHGEYEILVSMLRAHRIVDARLRWQFGRGHLVVLGDVFDRGPNHLEILWLLYQLEAEAAGAGGGAHFVLGNHEAMALSGDLRYLNAKYSETARVLGRSSYSELFAPDSLLGQWLRSRPVMLRVNDLLCLHAGVSRALVDSGLTLADVNSTARSALNGEPGLGAMAELVMGSLGPLWYRGYFPPQVNFIPATAEDVDLALEKFGARRILIGHTIVPTITPLYGGKVIAVQVFPKRDDTGKVQFESLAIRKGVLWQASVDGSLRRLASDATRKSGRAVP